MLGAEAPEDAAVGGQEEKRVLGRRLSGCGGARKLEERCGTGRVVVCARPGAGVVAVRDDRDHLVRGPRPHGKHVFELDSAAAGDFRVKTVDAHVSAKAVLGELLGDPGGRFLGR